MPIKVSKAHKAIVVPPEPGVLALFGDAPKLPDGNVVLPHGMRETLLLRHMGFKVPNPMVTHYNWCGGKPFDVQRVTCTMLSENVRAYVLNDMGTGKTKTALWAWDYLNKEGLCKKLLVVCKKSNMRFTWANEAFATLPHRKVKVLHGTRKQRLDWLAEEADIYVINHEGYQIIADAVAHRPDIDTLVLDELAVYRNNSDRSKLMRKHAQHFHIVWGMTGAPMPNEPTDVWAQCRIVTPTTVPQYFNRARDILMTKLSQYKYIAKPDAIDNAFRWMQPSVRFALDDVVELPPVVERRVDVPLSDPQLETYNKMAKAMQVMVQEKTITALNAGAAMNKLLQVAGGWVYHQSPEFVTLDATPRIDALFDLIESALHKVLVFIPFRHALEGICHVADVGYQTKLLKWDHCMVHGGVNNRDELFNAFQKTDKYRVMFAHPACVSHGLTLTAADTIIWYLPITSLEIFEQANARIRRVGQKHKQQLLMMQGTPVERRLYKLLESKQDAQEQFLSLIEEATDALG